SARSCMSKKYLRLGAALPGASSDGHRRWLRGRGWRPEALSVEAIDRPVPAILSRLQTACEAGRRRPKQRDSYAICDQRQRNAKTLRSLRGEAGAIETRDGDPPPWVGAGALSAPLRWR